MQVSFSEFLKHAGWFIGFLSIFKQQNSLMELSLILFILLGFSPCKAKHPLPGMKLKEKETQKD